ncbi:MAG: DnaJ domain-containing protein [Bryobacteraceae bacterium]
MGDLSQAYGVAVQWPIQPYIWGSTERDQMRVNMRQEQRRPAREIYSLCWQSGDGLARSTEVLGLDLSQSGVRVHGDVDLSLGQEVFVQAQTGHPSGYGTVRHCTPRDSGYDIGVEFHQDAKGRFVSEEPESIDYYEFLQISPKAEQSTIQRVYRFLASRYHPDNPDTGDSEKFLLLKQAYEVLSDPQRRAAYDQSRQDPEGQSDPAFRSVDFMDGIEGEINRRLGVLSLLYSKRRSHPDNPKVSLAEVEERMGFPREYLDFATWYLKSKKYITKADNSDFELTAIGVDFVEANATKIPILQKMLNSGSWVGTRRSTDSRSPFLDGTHRLSSGKNPDTEESSSES